MAIPIRLGLCLCLTTATVDVRCKSLTPKPFQLPFSCICTSLPIGFCWSYQAHLGLGQSAKVAKKRTLEVAPPSHPVTLPRHRMARLAHSNRSKKKKPLRNNNSNSDSDRNSNSNRNNNSSNGNTSGKTTNRQPAETAAPPRSPRVDQTKRDEPNSV